MSDLRATADSIPTGHPAAPSTGRPPSPHLPYSPYSPVVTIRRPIAHVIVEGVLRGGGAPLGVIIAAAFARALSVESFAGYVVAALALSAIVAWLTWRDRTELRADGLTIVRGFRTTFIPWWSLGAVCEYHTRHAASLVAIAPIAAIRLPAPHSTWGFRDQTFDEKRDVIHQWATTYAGPHIWR